MHTKTINWFLKEEIVENKKLFWEFVLLFFAVTTKIYGWANYLRYFI